MTSSSVVRAHSSKRGGGTFLSSPAIVLLLFASSLLLLLDFSFRGMAAGAGGGNDTNGNNDGGTDRVTSAVPSSDGRALDAAVPCSSRRGAVGGYWERSPHASPYMQYGRNVHNRIGRAANEAWKKRLESGAAASDPQNPTTTPTTINNKKYRPPTTYVWRDAGTTEGDCGGPITPLTGDDFCEQTQRLGLQRVLFVGDSMTYGQAYALRGQIGSLVVMPSRDGQGVLQDEHFALDHECMDGPAGWDGRRTVRVEFIRNNRMLEGDMIPPPTEPKQGKNQRSDYFGKFSDIYTSFPGRTLLVMNTGAHFIQHPSPPYEMAIDKFFHNLRVTYNRPDDIVFVRTTPAGHPTCRTATEPFANRKEYLEALAHPPEDVAERVDRYGWRTFEKMDDYLRESVEKYNARQQGGKEVTRGKANMSGHSGGGPPIVHLLDVTPMINLRPDGHTSGPDNLTPDNTPDKPGFDCLHYSSPGPVDWFNNLLFANLADMPSKVEA